MKKHRAWSISGAILVLGFLSGCGTIRGIGESWPEPEFYSGVRTDLHDISDGGVGYVSGLDLPLSFVADTVFVPVHAVLYARQTLLTPHHDGTQFQLQKKERRELPRRDDSISVSK